MKWRYLNGAVIAAALAYSGYWYYLAGKSEDILSAAVAKLQADGITLSYDNSVVSGFPYRLIMTLEGAQLKTDEGPYQFAWQGQNLDVITQPWTQDHLIFSAPNSVLNIQKDGHDYLKLTGQSVMMSLVEAGVGQTRYSLELQGAGATNGDGENLFKAETLGLHVRYGTSTSAPKDGALFGPRLADIALGARNLQPGDGDEPSTINIPEITTAMTFHGNSLPQYDRASLAGWSDSGGSIEIQRFNITLPAVTLMAEGDLSLDDQFRPLGALSTRLASPQLAAEALSGMGLISDQTGAALIAATAFLSAYSDDGGIPLSLTAQDGKLWLGPLEIGTLGPIIKE